MDETQIGRFPVTRISAVVAASSSDAEERARAFEVLVAAYWMPIYKYLRIKWAKSTEDAKDLTQGFFMEALQKNFFARYEPNKAKFRTFMRVCVDGYAANEHKAARRLKRGGELLIVSLDFDEAENQLSHSRQPDVNDIELYFEREWARSILSLSVQALREELGRAGKQVYFGVFERYLLGEASPTYRDLANEFAISTSDVTNYLSYSRREFRRIVLQKLRELTATDEEYRREARALLGIDPE